MDKNELESLVSNTLSERRQEHTRAVARLAVELARKYGISEEDAFTAAMLHDITKEVPIEEQLQSLQSSDIMDEMLLQDVTGGATEIYHGFTAFLLARDVYHIEKCDILNAIRYHSTGRASMSMLERIIFTADTVSYDRDYEDASRLRSLAFDNIDEAMLQIIDFIVSNLMGQRKTLCLLTVECYNGLVSRK